MGVPIFKETKDHHVYRNSEENVVPSVTTIAKIINKQELIGWANSLGFKRKSVTKELESASYIGTMTHDLIEQYTTTGQDQFRYTEIRGIAERVCIKNAYFSFLKWFMKEKLNIEYLRTECQLSGEKYGGTLDALINYNGKLTLVDYKTSSKFYPTMFLQLCAYDLLLRETEDIKVEQYMVILLDKKNGEEAKVMILADKDQMKIYKNCFKALVDFYYQWYFINQSYWGKELI